MGFIYKSFPIQKSFNYTYLTYNNYITTSSSSSSDNSDIDLSGIEDDINTLTNNITTLQTNTDGLSSIKDSYNKVFTNSSMIMTNFASDQYYNYSQTVTNTVKSIYLLHVYFTIENYNTTDIEIENLSLVYAETGIGGYRDFINLYDITVPASETRVFREVAIYRPSMSTIKYAFKLTFKDTNYLANGKATLRIYSVNLFN